LIKIDYLKNPDKKTTIGLVGKSITFDSGGICIKPRKDMDIMISDMSGGAALLGAYYFIAALQLPINAVFVLPAADNLPSGSAFKPGDILISKSGRTVLIKDTDSEGRVTLADGITAAVEAGVNAIVCVATLSGLTAMLFGEYFAPITSDNDDLSDLFTAAAEKVGEPLWRLPYISERPKETKSKVADVSNGERGTVFINGFAAGLPWAFVDIAGTAWTSKTEGIYCEGGTGTMVKTLAELLERFFAKKSPAM
jgi:leucyl aminopeptidase